MEDVFASVVPGGILPVETHFILAKLAEEVFSTAGRMTLASQFDQAQAMAIFGLINSGGIQNGRQDIFVAHQVRASAAGGQLAVGPVDDHRDAFDPACGEAALATFEFSQNLVERWRGSNSAQKRELLEVVSSNRKVSDVSLVLTKRKPFDFLVERPFLKKSRTTLAVFERIPLGFLAWFLDPSLQRNVIEELMADWVAGTLDDSPHEAYA